MPPYRTTIRSFLAAAGLVLAGVATSAAAQQSTMPAAHTSSGEGTLLSVSAHGEVTRAPDIARLSTGVVTRAADAQAAMQANAGQMSRVIDALGQAGIAERDIQTSGINLHPQYNYAENASGERQPPTITGYEARNTVQITVREIGELGEILDALVAAGANQINGPSFEVDDKQAAYDEARRVAIENARERARMYAETLNMRVRRIVSISEGGGVAPPRPMMEMDMARMEAASATTPVAPGENTLAINLDVVFELGQ